MEETTNSHPTKPALTGNVIAALSVSGPAYRFSPETFEAIAENLITVAENISLELSHLKT